MIAGKPATPRLRKGLPVADLPEANFALDRDPGNPTREVAYHVTPARNVDAILRLGLLLRRGHRARACREDGGLRYGRSQTEKRLNTGA